MRVVPHTAESLVWLTTGHANGEGYWRGCAQEAGLESRVCVRMNNPSTAAGHATLAVKLARRALSNEHALCLLRRVLCKMVA